MNEIDRKIILQTKRKDNKMEFHDITFFVNKQDVSDGPTANISVPTGHDHGWPITLDICQSNDKNLPITIHLRNESQLTQLVNSVKASYDFYRRSKGYDK